MTLGSYSNEFALVLACLRWPQTAADGDRIRSLARQPILWPRLLEIVDHHKVAPLFFRNLEHFAAGYMPQEHAAVLRASVEANQAICLRRTAHLSTLTRLFREQKIDFRIFKGVPLAIAAFGDPTLRDAGDIDLLVEEKNIVTAGEILRAEGFVRFEPQGRLTPRRLRSYMAHQKDFSYLHPTAGIVVDLHWRLFRNPWLPANARLENAGEEWLDIGSELIPTFPMHRLLLYLCVHGALDGWLRLKWLADIGALLHTMAPERLEATAQAAAEQQALPQLSAALYLCEELLGYDPLGPSPMPALCLQRTNPQVAHILRFSQRCITSNQCRPQRERIPSTRWFLNEARLHSSWRYRLDLVERSLFRPRAWRTFPLPDPLFPLYALLSPLDWLGFHVLRYVRMRKQPAQTRSVVASARRRWSFRRLWRRRPADLALVIEAVCMLSFFRVALNFLAVEKLTSWMGNVEQAQAVPVSPARSKTLQRIQWSIGAAVRHAPVTFVCFPQCLAAYFMLRRRGIASRLFYGVMRDARQLKAHTWVKVGERTVVGGEVEDQFTVLTTFPN